MKALSPKLILVFAIVLIQISIVYAAKINDPAPIIYGEINKEDFTFNIDDYPDFDPTSPAVILCDYGQEFFSEYGDSYQTRRIMHRRILILNKEGIDEANVEVWFKTDNNSYAIEKALSGAGKYGPFWINGKGEGIFKVKATSYNLTEQGIIEKNELDRSAVFVNDGTDLVGFDLLSFAIPKVNVGTIIEYTYTKVQSHFLLSSKWFFQYATPCLHSEFRIAYQETDTYAVIRNGLLRKDLEPVESELTTKQFRKFKQLIYKFKLEVIPGMPEQELVSTMDNYRTNIIIQLQRYWNYRRGEYKKIISTWEELSKEYLRIPEFGKQLFKYDNLFKQIKSKLPQPETVEGEIEVCYNFVRDYFIWNGRYRRMPENNLKEAFENIVASGVEINLFLARLLREFGINSKIAFASTRDNGWVNENYPFVLQFNHVICTIEIEGKSYLLDAINKQRPYNIPPASLIDTKVFILDYADPKIVKVKSNILFDQMMVISAEINKDQIQGKVQGRFKGYSALQRRSQIVEDSVEFMKDYLFNDIIDLKLETPTIINFKEKEKPLLIQVDFSFPDAIQYIDSLLIIELSSILLSIENPFVFEKRQFPVEFNFATKVEKLIMLKIPQGYDIDELPAPEKEMLDDGSAVVTVTYQKISNMLQIKIVLRTNELTYPIEQYSGLKDIFELWETLNSEPIVFVRK